MYCQHCGSVLPDGASFCPQCGKSEHYATQCGSTPPYAEVTTGYSYSQDYLKQSKNIFVYGILALSFACTFWLSFLGIVFGIKTLVASKRFVNRGNTLTGKAKVGSILGRVGMILGIALVCVLTFLVFLVILEAAVQELFYVP